MSRKNSFITSGHKTTTILVFSYRVGMQCSTTVRMPSDVLKLDV